MASPEHALAPDAEPSEAYRIETDASRSGEPAANDDSPEDTLVLSLRPEATEPEEPELEAEVGVPEYVAPEYLGPDDEDGEASDRAWKTPRSNIDRFEILEILGAGGTGVVYRAFDPKLEREVALKIIREGYGGERSSQRHEELLQEARAAARLNHPNVVSVHDVGTVGDRVFLVMELVRGEPLDAWLSKVEWQLDVILDLFIQAARGLQCAHRAGLVHGDFKPGNTLVGDDGRVRVADFGVARFVDQDSSWQTDSTRGKGLVLPAGTPGYMSPEQWRGDPVDERADQFSFCVALFEALFGTEPFDSSHLLTLMNDVLTGNLKAVDAPRVPARLREIITRGLQVHPQDRYPSIDGLLSDLVAARDYERLRVRQALSLVEGARAAYVQDNRVEARAKLRASLEEEDSLLGRALWARVKRDPVVWSIRNAPGDPCAVFPDGRSLATVISGSLNLIEAETASRQIHRLGLPDAQALAVSADGQIVVVADARGRIVWWFVKSQTAKWVQAHTGPCTVATFVGKSSVVISAGFDGRVLAWQDGVLLDEIRDVGAAVHGLAPSPEGDELVWHDASGAVEWAEIQPGGARKRLATIVPRLCAVQYAPNGRWVATPGPETNEVLLWARSSRGALTRHQPLRGHQHTLRAFAFTSDSTGLLSADFGGDILLWDVIFGQIRRRLHEPAGSQIRGIDVVGDRVVTSGEHVVLWDLQVRDDPKKPEDVHMDGGPVLVTDRVFAATREGPVCVFSQRGEYEGLLVGHHGCVMDIIALGPDLLATGAHDGTIRLWNTRTRTQLKVMHGHGAAVSSLTPRGDTLVSGSWDQTVREWSLDGLELRRWNTSFVVLSVAASPDGSLVAVTGLDGTVKLLDLDGGEDRTLPNDQMQVWGAAWSRCGRRLAWSGSKGEVLVWDRQTDALARYAGPVSRPAFRLSFHPDGKQVVVPYVDGTLRRLDLDTGDAEEICATRSELNGSCFAPDGRWVAVSCGDGVVRTWSTATLRPHWRGPVLLPDGTTLTHRGWSGPRAPRLPPACRQMLEQRATYATFDKGFAYALTHPSKFELWDREADAPVFELGLQEPTRIWSWRGACLVLHGTSLRCFRGPAPAWHLDGVRAVQPMRQDCLLVLDEHLAAIGPHEDSPRRVRRIPTGVTAVTLSHDEYVLGFQDGGLEVMPGSSSSDAPLRGAFEDTPASPVVEILEGPAGSVIASFANGALGLWSQRDGKKLLGVCVHGRLHHLQLDGSTLRGLSELGDELELDLGEFTRDFESLRAEIVSQIPLVWDRGLPRLAG